MSGWQPISTAPLDEPVTVGWLMDDGAMGQDTTAVCSDEREEWLDMWGLPLVQPDGWRPLGGES